MTLAYSTDYKFAEDQIAIKGTERIDIVVHDVGDTTVGGPVVGLVTAKLIGWVIGRASAPW